MPVDVNLTTATESVQNAGLSMITLAILMLGLAIVYGFLRKRG